MELWFFGSALIVFLLLVDDLFIDILSLFFKLGPESQVTKGGDSFSEEKSFLAIMVANWKEYDVLESMLAANGEVLKDTHVHIFLGVYPNDTKTKEMAEKVAKTHSQIHVVVNARSGPTYKGQMLDEIINGILLYEKQESMVFSGFIMHDSEDLIDPQSIALYRENLVDSDFIQVPVLSFNLPWSHWIGGTYLDEFAESHSKDMLVRQKIGAAIPSAGVGTCLKRKLVLFFKNLNHGHLFPNKDLTEDYILGLEAARFGFRSRFLAKYFRENQENFAVATREYFPNSLKSAIRQKSRWTLGICYQSWQRIGWFGKLPQLYFLWRDRKAILAPFVTLNCLLLIPFMMDGGVAGLSHLRGVLMLNTSVILLRLFIRMRWVYFHYGWLQALLAPVRWPLAIFVNTSAGLVAFKEFLQMNFLGQEIQWKKTEHKFIAVEDLKIIKNKKNTENNALEA